MNKYTFKDARELLHKACIERGFTRCTSNVWNLYGDGIVVYVISRRLGGLTISNGMELYIGVVLRKAAGRRSDRSVRAVDDLDIKLIASWLDGPFEGTLSRLRTGDLYERDLRRVLPALEWALDRVVPRYKSYDQLKTAWRRLGSAKFWEAYGICTISCFK